MPNRTTVFGRSPRFSRVLGPLVVALGAAAFALTVATPATAAPTTKVSTANVPTTKVPTEPTSQAPTPANVPVSTLRATGVRTDVVVRGLRRRSQARWIDHVIGTRLVSIDGCIADPSDSTRRRGTYRVHVNVVCQGGTAPARQAAAALVRGRPWYRVRVRTVPVVAFTFVADLEQGSGNAVGAALDRLPSGDFFFADGDDVSLTYIGQGVTQTQLDAALAAFARTLRIPASRVAVSPLRWS